MTALDQAFRIAIVAMVAEFGLAFGLGLFTPGHHLIHDYISSSSAVGAPLAGAGFLLGFTGAGLHLVFVRATWDAFAGWVWGHVAAFCFGGFFVAIAVSALFQCDPGCALETTEAVAHTALGFVAFTFLGLAAVAIVLGLWRRHDLRGRPYLFAVSAAMIAADLGLLAGHLLGMYPGLVERLTIVAMWLWTVALWRFVRFNGPVWAGIPSTAPR